MRVSHSPQLVSAAFDDPNLVSCAGPAPVVAWAHRSGLAELVAGTLTLPVKGGVNAHLKIAALIGGTDLLTHGGMDWLFAGGRAPSPLGTFLPAFPFGHVRQLDSDAATMLAELARRTPLLAGAEPGGRAPCCTVRTPPIPGSDMAGIAVEDRGPVRLAVIDNQPTRNAFTSEMAMDLTAVFDEAEADPAVRCVVVTAAGNQAFSSGHDLNEVLVHPENASDPVKNAAFVRPTTMTTPVLAAVNGAAYAAGFILALSCDLRIASRNAAFGASGTRIGLLPVGGQLSRLVALASYPVAFELTATAAPMPAERAYHVGLVSRLTEPGQSLDAALEMARAIAGNSPAVVRSVKAGLRRTLSDGLDAGLRYEQEQAAVLRSLPDGAEGVQAFLGRRPPVYPDAPVDLPGL